jgi:integrase
MLMLGQGTRIGESLLLDASEDVFLEYGYIILRMTKANRERRITLIPKVKAALSTLPNIGTPGPLFRAKTGEPFSNHDSARRNFTKLFKAAVDAAGMDSDKYTAHVCRHTWATWHYAQHQDVLRLKQEGGWASGEYERYTKLASDDLAQEAVDAGWDLTGWKRAKLKEVG